MYGFKEFLADDNPDGELIQTYLGNPKLPVSDIARMYQKTESEVYRILHANDVSPNRLRANHQKVRGLANLGWGIREIAEFTGYTSRNVRYILKSITEG